MHIKKYLETRTDNNEALFVSVIKPYNRLGISGIEIAIRNIEREANINKYIYINLEERWQLWLLIKECQLNKCKNYLGHIKIDTTMEYAMLSQNNVKNSHRIYVT